MLKYIYMGTPPLAATILEMLCDKLYSPVAVVTQIAKATGRHHKVTPSAVEESGKRLDLNVISSLNVNAPPTLDVLKTFSPDLIIIAAFGQILREDILKLPKIFCLNVHGSLLPAYRGAAPVQRAIMNGDKKTGVTIQRIVRKLDAGDILLKKETEILPDETSGELMIRLAVLGGEALIESIKLIEANHYTLTPQDESEVSHAAKLEKEEAVIHWSETADQISNKIRGLQPWPVAETLLGSVRLKIFKVEKLSTLKNLIPGQIETDNKSFLHVGCGTDTLSLLELQLDNRKRLKIHDFLLAYRGNFPFSIIGQ